jgi:anti-sigma regulatory factor (Ser/Thr protein kinase)
METRKISVRNKPEELALILDFIEGLGTDWGLGAELIFRLNLILEEYINNLISYGFNDNLPHEISIEISLVNENILKGCVVDDGNPFDITAAPENEDLGKSLEERKIGGLGIHFIKTLAKEIDYRIVEGENKFTFLLTDH